MLHIWGLSFWVQPFHARFPLSARLPPHHCSVRICCPFCTFVKAIVTFFSAQAKQAQQAKTTHRQRQKQLSVACCPFIIHFLPLECVCVYVWSWASCALCQKATVSLLNVSLCFCYSFCLFLASACCLLILCVCCCCLRQLAAVSCLLPLLVASNRINMLPMSVATAYFKSKQAMFFLKPPPTHTHTVDIVERG